MALAKDAATWFRRTPSAMNGSDAVERKRTRARVEQFAVRMAETAGRAAGGQRQRALFRHRAGQLADRFRWRRQGVGIREVLLLGAEARRAGRPARPPRHR